jgi:hypothetical protein
MMPTVILVPVPIPVWVSSNNGGWKRRAPVPPYPTTRREQWAPRQAIPSPRDTQALRDMLDDARRRVAGERAALARFAHGRP